MNLSEKRREYMQGGLDEDQLPAQALDLFRRWLQEAISADLNNDPTAMILATVSSDGQPSQRTVLLKEIDTGLVFFTNYGSRKAREIAGNAQVSLLFPWLALERQVIVFGRAEKLSMTESARYFLSRPRDSQLGAWASRQSSPVSARSVLDKAFAQMKERFSEGQVPVPAFWGGYRVLPTRYEFWQGRENRLHDRFEYRKIGNEWDIKRLQP